MFTSKFQLHLYPENSQDSITTKQLISSLEGFQFIATAEISSSKNYRFLTGEKFLSYLGFLGCSPDIEFQPNGEQPYIYIEIPPTSEKATFCSGVNVKIPRCSQCKKELSALPSVLKKGTDNTLVQCTNCLSELKLDKLNWRKTAYFSCSAIIVNNIYEAEAVPNDILLIQLEKATGFAWKYAYIRLEGL